MRNYGGVISQQFPCLVYNWVSPLRRLTWWNFRYFLLLFVFLGRLSNWGWRRVFVYDEVSWRVRNFWLVSFLVRGGGGFAFSESISLYASIRISGS